MATAPLAGAHTPAGWVIWRLNTASELQPTLWSLINVHQEVVSSGASCSTLYTGKLSDTWPASSTREVLIKLPEQGIGMPNPGHKRDAGKLNVADAVENEILRARLCELHNAPTLPLFGVAVGSIGTGLLFPAVEATLEDAFLTGSIHRRGASAVLGAVLLVLRCVARLHKAGVAHCDIRPDKVGVVRTGNTGCIRLLDAASCRLRQEPLSAQDIRGWMVPTAEYLDEVAASAADEPHRTTTTTTTSSSSSSSSHWPSSFSSSSASASASVVYPAIGKSARSRPDSGPERAVGLNPLSSASASSSTAFANSRHHSRQIVATRATRSNLAYDPMTRASDAWDTTAMGPSTMLSVPVTATWVSAAPQTGENRGHNRTHAHYASACPSQSTPWTSTGSSSGVAGKSTAQLAPHAAAKVSSGTRKPHASCPSSGLLSSRSHAPPRASNFSSTPDDEVSLPEAPPGHSGTWASAGRSHSGGLLSPRGTRCVSAEAGSERATIDSQSPGRSDLVSIDTSGWLPPLAGSSSAAGSVRMSAAGTSASAAGDTFSAAAGGLASHGIPNALQSSSATPFAAVAAGSGGLHARMGNGLHAHGLEAPHSQPSEAPAGASSAGGRTLWRLLPTETASDAAGRARGYLLSAPKASAAASARSGHTGKDAHVVRAGADSYATAHVCLRLLSGRPFRHPTAEGVRMDHLEPCPLAGYRAAAHWEALNRLWHATYTGTTTGGVKAACEALPNVLAGVMDPRCTASVASALTSLLRLCGSQQASTCMQEARTALASSLRVGQQPVYAASSTPPTPIRTAASSSASSSGYSSSNNTAGTGSWGDAASAAYPNPAHAQTTAARFGMSSAAGQAPPVPVPAVSQTWGSAPHANSWAAAARPGVVVASSGTIAPEFGFGIGTGWGMAPAIVPSPPASSTFAGVIQPATATLRSGRRTDTGRAAASMELAAAPASTIRSPEDLSQASDSRRFAFA